MSFSVKQLFPKHKKAPTGDFGIELELEFPQEQVWDINPKAWTVKPELSLRHSGYEVVSKYPLSLEELEPMVEDVCKNINARSPIVDSPRTSVHVHLNMTKNELLQALNCTVAYWLLETPLTRYCGEEREGHHFCLRLKDAEALVPVLCKSLKQDIPMKSLGDNVRYAGLNLNALNKFGSLEFRAMNGTTKPKRIVSWAEGLHHLCSVAKTFESPAHVFDYYLACSKEEFVRRFLNETLAGAVLGTPGYQDMMDESASIVCALAYAEEWKEWEKNLLDKYKAKNKEVPTLGDYEDYLNLGVSTIPSHYFDEDYPA